MKRTLALVVAVVIVPACGGGGGGGGGAPPPPAGSLDTTFCAHGYALAALGSPVSEATGVAVQSDGRIVVVGKGAVAGTFSFILARFRPDGRLDTTFGISGYATTDFGGAGASCYAVALQPDGKIVAVGTASSATVADFAVARFDSGGTLDASFGTGGLVTSDMFGEADAAYAVTIQTDGKIVVAGTAAVSGSKNFAVARYNADGSPDTSFGGGDGVALRDFSGGDDTANAVAVQSDGKIVTAGSALIGTSTDFALWRCDATGIPDGTFGSLGRRTTDFAGSFDSAQGLAIQPDGKILAAGHAFFAATNYDFAVARYNADGTPDTDFDTDGKATGDFSGSADFGNAMRLLADGRFLVAGYAAAPVSYAFAVARFSASGGMEAFATLDLGGDDRANAMDLQADGKVVLAGTAGLATVRMAVARLDGSLAVDSAFGAGTCAIDPSGSDDELLAVAIQPDGKIVAAGYARPGAGDKDIAVARFLADGTPDVTFSGDGVAVTDVAGGDDVAYAVAIQPDGMIVVAGSQFNGASDAFVVARYEADGDLDPTFSGDGLAIMDLGGGSDGAHAVAIQTDGKIVAAGEGFNGTDVDIAVIRWEADGDIDPTFDGDGVAITDGGGSTDRAYAMALKPDGKILVAGESGFGTAVQFALLQYLPDGTLDGPFSGTVVMGSSSSARAIAVQPDGMIVLAGRVTPTPGAEPLVGLARVLSTGGALDFGFDLDGKVTYDLGEGPEGAYGVALQADGRIVVAGFGAGIVSSALLARYRADGELDAGFDASDGDSVVLASVGGVDDSWSAVALQADGRIVTVGHALLAGQHDASIGRFWP